MNECLIQAHKYAVPKSWRQFTRQMRQDSCPWPQFCFLPWEGSLYPNFVVLVICVIYEKYGLMADTDVKYIGKGIYKKNWRRIGRLESTSQKGVMWEHSHHPHLHLDDGCVGGKFWKDIYWSWCQKIYFLGFKKSFLRVWKKNQNLKSISFFQWNPQ